MGLLRIAYGIKFDNKTPYKLGNWVLIGLTKRIDNDRKLAKKEKGVWNPEHWFYENRGMARYENFRRYMPDQKQEERIRIPSRSASEQERILGRHIRFQATSFRLSVLWKVHSSSKHVTWNKAQKHCEDVGLTFATVENEQENRELLFAAEITLGETLYGKRFNNSNWVWIGEKEQMNEDGEGNGIWTHWNDSPLPYKPKWDFKRQPDNWIRKRGEQSVVALSRKNGKWDDSFPFKKRPFACMCKERACQFA